MMKISRPISSSVGPKPTIRLSHSGTFEVSDCAFSVTPFFSSSCESAFVSANEGISVWKSVDGFEPP